MGEPRRHQEREIEEDRVYEVRKDMCVCTKLCVMTAQQSRIAPIRFVAAKPSSGQTRLSFSDAEGETETVSRVKTHMFHTVRSKLRLNTKRDATVAALAERTVPRLVALLADRFLFLANLYTKRFVPYHVFFKPSMSGNCLI